MQFLGIASTCTTLISLATALTISEINGIRFLSPYAGQAVTGIEGLVTAKGPSGFFLRSTTAEDDDRSSSSIYIYGSAGIRNVTVGDIITVDGTVTEYRSAQTYLYLTEITSPKNIVVLSQGNQVTPLLIGESSARQPPAEQYTLLDNGDIYSIPNNSSLISALNPVLDPASYGLDFWESLSGELVTLEKATAIAKPNSYGDTWVVGGWNATGRNSRGGLTMTDQDSNPESIMVISPLDGTKNPLDTKLGDSLGNITGILTQTFGFYCFYPLTALKVTASQTPAVPPPTTLVANGKCDQVTFGVYNVENLTPTSAILPSIAGHIVTYLKAPTVMIVQEIQDNNGVTNDAVVSSSLTLATLVASIKSQSNISYAFTTIDPESNQDGGQPGGNIRVAYLYQPAKVRLHSPNPGNSTQATEVLAGPTLSLNPGRIDPQNEAWASSRKPLAAEWETLDGRNRFFTVNTHFASKGGSSSLQGDARPPVNGVVEGRRAQSKITAEFIAQILALDPEARIIAAGDFNEFSFVAPLEEFKSISGLLDMDEVAGIDPSERYTYLFDMNCQQLDHMFVSPALARRSSGFEHVHVNTWANFAGQISDHDPSVAKLNICE